MSVQRGSRIFDFTGNITKMTSPTMPTRHKAVQSLVGCSGLQHAREWGKIHNVVKHALDALINATAKANDKNKSGAAVGYLTGTPSQMKLG